MFWVICIVVMLFLAWGEVLPVRRWMYAICISIIGTATRFLIDCLDAIDSIDL